MSSSDNNASLSKGIGCHGQADRGNLTLSARLNSKRNHDSLVLSQIQLVTSGQRETVKSNQHKPILGHEQLHSDKLYLF